MARILVTGGLGFIGTNLVARLLQENIGDVRVLDKNSPGQSGPQAFDLSRVEYIQGDICDKVAVKKALEGCTDVIHLAADKEVIRSVENPQENFNVNVSGTFNILQEMRVMSPAPYMINASTGGAILGEAPSPVHEDMPARPLSPYGASKLAAEGYCFAFAATYGLKICSLRFSNIYGPYSGNKGNVIPAFISRVLNGENLVVYGNGEQTRDWLYIDDLIDGILSALEKKITGVYQLGTGKPSTINQLIENIRDLAGDRFHSEVCYEPARPGEVTHNYCSIDRARERFAFNPRTSFPEGLKKTWDWFLSPPVQEKKVKKA